jgi:hypothetical protein
MKTEEKPLQTPEVEYILKLPFFNGSSPKKGFYFSLFDISGVKIEDLALPREFTKVAIEQLNIDTLIQILNMDYKEFVYYKSMTNEIIADAKDKILEYLLLNIDDLKGKRSEFCARDDQDVDYKTLDQFPLFSSSALDHILLDRELLECPLDSVLAHHKILKSLKDNAEIKTLGGLLNINQSDFLDKFKIDQPAIMSLQKQILSFVRSKIGVLQLIANGTKLDEYIKEEVVCQIDNPVDSLILLKRLSYMAPKASTLDSIGRNINLTRERVRQIEERWLSHFKLKPYPLVLVYDLIKKGGVVIEIKDMANNMIDLGIWSKHNLTFFNGVIDFIAANKKDVIKDRNFLFNVPKEKISCEISYIRAIMEHIIKKSDSGIASKDLMKLITSAILDNNDKSLLKVLCEDLLKYIAYISKEIFYCNREYYNKTIYNIKFGDFLEDVIYSCMIMLGDQVHYIILADYVRKNNNHHHNISNEAVLSFLIRAHFANNVGRGVYALKQWNIPNHVPVGEALINLVKEKGPILEGEIIKELEKKYTPCNIKMAFINNSHKLTKIGNDLYDYKGA